MKFTKSITFMLLIPLLFISTNFSMVTAVTSNVSTRMFTTAYFPNSQCNDRECEIRQELLVLATAFKFTVEYRSEYSSSTADPYIEFTRITVSSAVMNDPHGYDVRVAISYQKPDSQWVYQENIVNGDYVAVAEVSNQDNWARYIGWNSEELYLNNPKTDFKVDKNVPFILAIFWNGIRLNIQMSTAHFTMYGWSAYNYEDIVYHAWDTTDKYYGKIFASSSLTYFGYATQTFSIPAYPSGGGGGGCVPPYC